MGSDSPEADGAQTVTLTEKRFLPAIVLWLGSSGAFWLGAPWELSATIWGCGAVAYLVELGRERK